jgi:twitching motility protein PilU
MPMEQLFKLMSDKKASDLFIAPGSPLHLKLNGNMVPIGQQKLTPETVTSLLREIISDKKWAEFEDSNELNMGHGVAGIGSFRISVLRQRGSPAAVIRFIPSHVPPLAELEVPPILSELILEKRGLILLVGATGSGKSTTLAAMIDHRNTVKSGHILTLEDPIEFIFRNKRSIINQREVGTDTDSLEIALKNAMRQSPDCILIGEIRDAKQMSAAIAYSQSGHLVLATLHANNSYHALGRIISFYSPENRSALLGDLGAALKSIICMRLVRNKAGARTPAVEILLNTSHIAELIENSRIPEIKEAMQNSLAPGSQTFDQALLELVRTGKISKEEAIANADSATNLLWLLDNAAAPAAAAPANSPTAPRASPNAETQVNPLNPGPNAAKPSELGSASFSEFMLNI